MLGFKVHQVLKDIMDLTFVDNEFTKFYIEMIPKEYATFHGRYYRGQRKIEVFNLSRKPKHILTTTIHELAHHVDVNIRGCTGHDKHFYFIHKALLSTAVGMGVITLNDIAIITDSADAEKLSAHFGEIEEWVCLSIDYRCGKSMIKVKFSFSIKDILKSRGYKYSKDEKLWEKEFDNSILESEVSFLSLKINKNNIIVKSSSNVDFEIIYELTAHTTEKNYEKLKQLKYKPIGNGKIYKKFIQSVQLDSEICLIKGQRITPIKLRISGKQAYSG